MLSARILPSHAAHMPPGLNLDTVTICDNLHRHPTGPMDAQLLPAWRGTSSAFFLLKGIVHLGGSGTPAHLLALVCSGESHTWKAVALLCHGDVADALVVGVGPEVGAVGDVVEVLDAIPSAHVPATHDAEALSAVAVLLSKKDILNQGCAPSALLSEPAWSPRLDQQQHTRRVLESSSVTHQQLSNGSGLAAAGSLHLHIAA